MEGIREPSWTGRRPTLQGAVGLQLQQGAAARGGPAGRTPHHQVGLGVVLALEANADAGVGVERGCASVAHAQPLDVVLGDVEPQPAGLLGDAAEVQREAGAGAGDFLVPPAAELTRGLRDLGAELAGDRERVVDDDRERGAVGGRRRGATAATLVRLAVAVVVVARRAILGDARLDLVVLVVAVERAGRGAVAVAVAVDAGRAAARGGRGRRAPLVLLAVAVVVDVVAQLRRALVAVVVVRVAVGGADAAVSVAVHDGVLEVTAAGVPVVGGRARGIGLADVGAGAGVLHRPVGVHAAAAGIAQAEQDERAEGDGEGERADDVDVARVADGEGDGLSPVGLHRSISLLVALQNPSPEPTAGQGPGKLECLFPCHLERIFLSS